MAKPTNTDGVGQVDRHPSPMTGAESSNDHGDGEEATEVDLVRSTLLESVGTMAPATADVRQLTGGASRSTWLVQTDGESYVVQRQRPDTGREMDAEVEVLRAAAAAGVKVPPLVDFVVAADGAPTLITEYVPGETIARRILRDERFVVARQRLVGDLGAAAAAIHRIDADGLTNIPTIDDQVAEYRARLDELGEPHPTFELVLRWLDEHRPPDRPAAIVHGDLRLGNVIVDEAGLAAVIDWELVHRANPVEDLGWLCVPAWRFGGSAPVAGLGTREELLDAYRQAGGADVEIDELRWWEIFGTLRWGVICVMQANIHLSGSARSHELAAIGRRTCETELDLFVALEGRW